MVHLQLLVRGAYAVLRTVSKFAYFASIVRSNGATTKRVSLRGWRRMRPEHMSGKFLIDFTDDRFKIPVNAAVIEFIRRTSPFAHSDVGSILLDLRKWLPGVEAYCPSYGSCAYVVLHDDAHRIFAIAYGQRGLALRLDPSSYATALDDGGTREPIIGADWLSFTAFDRCGETGAQERLRRWSAQALADAPLHEDV